MPMPIWKQCCSKSILRVLYFTIGFCLFYFTELLLAWHGPPHIYFWRQQSTGNSCSSCKHPQLSTCASSQLWKNPTCCLSGHWSRPATGLFPICCLHSSIWTLEQYPQSVSHKVMKQHAAFRTKSCHTNWVFLFIQKLNTFLNLILQELMCPFWVHSEVIVSCSE